MGNNRPSAEPKPVQTPINVRPGWLGDNGIDPLLAFGGMGETYNAVMYRSPRKLYTRFGGAGEWHWRKGPAYHEEPTRLGV